MKETRDEQIQDELRQEMNPDMDMNIDSKHKAEWGKTILSILFYLRIAIVSLWLLTGCVEDEEEPVKVEKVLLVYLGGDNNLSGDATQKFNAIVSGYRPFASRRVLIYQDTGLSPSLQEIDENGNLITLESYGDENSADPQVFSRVIRQSKARYPEADFNLLVFSHGTGWLPSGTYTKPREPVLRSIVVDQNSEMELSDLARAIPDDAFEWIILEACHTAGIEVAYELKDKADYIIGSSAEIVSPGFTDIYASSINDLVEGDPKKFAEKAFNHVDSQSGQRRSSTLSIIKTDELDELALFVKANCDFTKAVNITNLQYFDRMGYQLFADFEDYYSRLLSTEQVQKELNRLINKCIIWKASTGSFLLPGGTGGFMIRQHSGLTTYVPQSRYSYLNQRYESLDWSHAIQ